MKQLLKIKPKGKFFFGGDRTFASERQSYYAHSEYFPQQTAILGMLRFTILQIENKLEESLTVKQSFIGENDFNGKTEFSFGNILKISPVFIIENEKSWIAAGKDHQHYKDDDTKEIVPIRLKLDVKSANSPIGNFNYKEKFESRFILFQANQDDFGITQDLDFFFQEHTQVGVDVNKERKTKQDGFYKHDLLSFKRDAKTYKSDFAFAVWVETKDDYSFKDFASVSLGRESTFSIEVVENAEDIFEQIEATNNTFEDSTKIQIVLLNNAFIENLDELRAASDFILAGSPVPFKFIKSAKDDKHFSMPKDGGRRSAQYYLLERGTVIYPKNLIEIKKLLDNPAFQTIGYNHYRILTRA
jgi:CRISPR-associated protein Cmr3